MIVGGELVVGQSETEAGTGRPAHPKGVRGTNPMAAAFSDASPDSYVFPFHRVAVAGNERRAWIYGINLSRPMATSGSRKAFDTARKLAGVDYRIYDARHTFVTPLAENPAVSEETIRQLAGHVSPRMLSRYAHIRAQARQAAIATLEPEEDSPQFSPQSAIDAKPVLN